MSHFIQVTFNSRTKELDSKTKNLMGQADDYLKNEDFDQAEREVDRALEIYPDNEKLLGMKADIRLKRNKKISGQHIEKAMEYLKFKNYESARKELVEAVMLTPESTDAQSQLGTVYFKQGEYKAAMACYKKTLEIDKNHKESKIMLAKIMQLADKQKPVWLKEDKYYKKKTLVFDDFQEDSIIPKLITDQGEFENIKDGDERYSKWKVSKEETDKKLRTAIRLPNLAKFKGMMMSLKSDGIKVLKIVLVEQRGGKENNWEVPISGITKEWKNIKVPFHYLQLPNNPTAQIDLSRVARIMLVIDSKSSGWMGIDNIEFYQ